MALFNEFDEVSVRKVDQFAFKFFSWQWGSSKSCKTLPMRPALTPVQWNLLRPILAMMALFALAGCSDLQFAGEENLVPQKDPREDIVLTNVSTQMTSGGVVQQKVRGAQAVYSQTQNELTIRDIQVTALADGGDTRSVTNADLGQIYFADRPEEDIGRSDMKFAGNVLYRNPQKNDPTTDSMRLMSELIVWDESEEKFKSPHGYEMLLLPKGRTPVRQWGKGFEATQDLSRFVVRTGTLTTEMTGDPMEERAAMEAQFDAWRREVDEGAKNRPPLPTPMTLPPRQ